MDGRTVIGKTVVFGIICVFMAVFLYLFGTGYAVLGVNVAVAALVMLSKDMSVRPFSNLGSILGMLVLMGVGSYIGSLDPYLGVVVNFVVVFLVVFLSMQDLNSPMHFPLLLFYASMVTMPITVNQMPDRILILAVSAVFIVCLNVFVNRRSRNRTGHNGVIALCQEIDRCASDVLEGGKPEHEDIDRMAVELNRRLYDRMKSRFITTPKKRTAMDLVVSLADLGRVVCRGEWSPQALEGLKEVIEIIISHERGDTTASLVSSRVEEYLAANPGIAYGTGMILRDVANALLVLESGENEYDTHRMPDMRRAFATLMDEARRDSIRFTFAVRMALVFSLVVFAWDYWDWADAKVMVFTVIAIVVPYLEESGKRSAMRLSGTVAGGLIFIMVFAAIGGSTTAMMAVGMLAAYLYVLLDTGRYDRKMFFYTLLILIVSSLSSPAPVTSGIALERIEFTVMAMVISIIANRVVLPYRVKDENMELSVRSIRISLERIFNLRDLVDGKPDAEEESYLSARSASISQKMLLNSDDLDDPLSKRFLMRQDSLSVQCSSLYKAIPTMSPACREAVGRMLAADPETDDPLPLVNMEGLDAYEEECVRRARSVISTYRRNRKLMFRIIVEGFLDESRRPGADGLA